MLVGIVASKMHGTMHTRMVVALVCMDEWFVMSLLWLLINVFFL